jgi:hypothetical protein
MSSITDPWDDVRVRKVLCAKQNVKVMMPEQEFAELGEPINSSGTVLGHLQQGKRIRPGPIRCARHGEGRVEVGLSCDR